MDSISPIKESRLMIKISYAGEEKESIEKSSQFEMSRSKDERGRIWVK